MRHAARRYIGEEGKAAWGELERITALGFSRNDVFSDWLDLLLDSFLALTDNVHRNNPDPSKFDGTYNERYLKTIGRYARDTEPAGRPADHFSNAAALLIAETVQKEKDVLGEIYQQRITFGEHGQFFTPEHIADMMVAMAGTNGREIADMAGCGSGRLLLAAGKRHPDAILHGMDVDARCAKMATLNMVFRNLNAQIAWGDGLSGSWRTRWIVRKGGWVIEQENNAP